LAEAPSWVGRQQAEATHATQLVVLDQPLAHTAQGVCGCRARATC
jgi:hypothetical protein